MKPWNKIKWQKESAKLANKPLDDFDAYMNEICPTHGIRRWDCIKQDHKTVALNEESVEHAQDQDLPEGHSGSSLTCQHPFCVAERTPPANAQPQRGQG